MATSVTLPALGESVTEGTVTRWLKQEGDTVEADEPLLEVSTDKVDTEIPSPAAGTLLSIKVQEDETVEVGAELAVIGDAADAGSGGGDEGAPAGGGADESDSSAVDVTSDEGSAGEQAEGGGSGQTAQETSEPIGVSTGSADSGSSGSESASGGSGSGTSSGGASDNSSGGSLSGSSGGSDTGVSVTLPALGESVTEGTVTRWLKQEGDTVEADEPLLEVSTDKVDTEIPSPAAGTLLSIKVQEDETVEVGAVLAVIGSPAQGSDASGDGGQAAESGDESGVPTDEKPAVVEEKALAEQQQSRIEAESSSAAPAASTSSSGSSSGGPTSGGSSSGGAATSASRDDGPSGEQSTSTASSATPEPSKAPAQTSAAGGASSSASASANGAGDGSTSDGAYVTPLVRKLASDAGIQLNEISGSGVGGRIRKQDVLEAAAARESAAAKAAADAEAAKAAASQPSAAPSGGASTAPAASSAPASASASLRGQTVKMTRMRAFIAKRMVESLQVSAQLTTVVEVDVTQIARLRNQAKAGFQAREGVKLSFLPFFAKAAIEALREYPTVNSSINSDTNEVTYHGAEHLGIAVDTERGLIVPVIHDAGDLNIGGLSRKIADLAERTRTNKISPDELSGGTFTLTNTGSRGALFDTPILNQPQVGILGTGAVVKRPVVIDDPRLGETIVVRSMVYLALTYDHRIVDGADAARFLVYMKQRLEEGQFEADLGL